MPRRDGKVRMLEARLGSGRGVDEVAALAATGDVVRCPAGRVVARQGQPGREAFVILAGEVEVRRRGEVLARLGPGEVVGELAVVGRGLRNADVVAATTVELLVFDPRSFTRALKSAPSLRARVEQALVERQAA